RVGRGPAEARVAARVSARATRAADGGGADPSPVEGAGWRRHQQERFLDHGERLGHCRAGRRLIDLQYGQPYAEPAVVAGTAERGFCLCRIAAPEGGKAAEAVRRIFPAALNRSVYYSYSPQSDPGPRDRLRLAIYENDGDAFRLAIAAYDKAYSAAMGPHILEDLFADTILDVSWLASRDLDIQFRLFWVKLGRLLSTRLATADMPALLAHYRDREDMPGHAGFKWALLRVDILAGELAAAKRKILSMPEASPETAPSAQHLLLGSVKFLEGRNDEAIAEYRQALKLYAKEIGRRKVFFEGSNGLFFLLALIRANDFTLH